MKSHITHSSILAAYIDVAAFAPDGFGNVSDALNREGLSPRMILARSYALSRVLAKRIGHQDKRVGLLLPTGLGTVCSFMALHMLGRTPTMLNFVTSHTNVLHACALTPLRTIITSRVFIEKANLSALIGELAAAGHTLCYLEDVREEIGTFEKLCGFAVKTFPKILHMLTPTQARDHEAVILFTSGSEGVPKGVALSHHNILSNINQFIITLDIGAHDRMFNCLPMYHSFGLTVGTLLPLLTCMQTMLYPSPLHYHEIPRLIEENKSTILLSTDTFLTGYARNGTAAQFSTLRYIVAGAEKLKETTIDHWRKAFGKTLYEGYGVTETAPVLSVNTPDAYKDGAVGKLLPDIEHKIKPVADIHDGGELWVRGPNVMMGYIKSDEPGVIQPLADGWHNTGDIADVDANGFITIRGRLKRFAKIAGEMVSLVTVEQAVSRVWPGVLHAVVNVPHARKGEALVLLTEKENATLDELIATFKANSETQIPLPRQIFTVPAIPILGPGKLDFIGAREMALALIENEAVRPDEGEASAAQAVG